MGREIVHAGVVVQEVVLDYIPSVAGTYDKISQTKRGKRLHEVPENWLAANFYHWLWLVLSFLTHTSAEAAG